MHGMRSNTCPRMFNAGPFRAAASWTQVFLIRAVLRIRDEHVVTSETTVLERHEGAFVLSVVVHERAVNCVATKYTGSEHFT